MIIGHVLIVNNIPFGAVVGYNAVSLGELVAEIFELAQPDRGVTVNRPACNDVVWPVASIAENQCKIAGCDVLI